MKVYVRVVPKESIQGDLSPSVTKASDVLQLIHFDLSGMLPVTSLGGCSSYMTFIDDFSHKT